MCCHFQVLNADVGLLPIRYADVTYIVAVKQRPIEAAQGVKGSTA